MAQAGGYEGRPIVLRGDRISIGRGAQNEIQIEESIVSAMHAEITASADGTFSIEDLDSRNGTFVNERRVTGKSEFRAGDMVRIARFEFLVEEVPATIEPGKRRPPGSEIRITTP